MAGGLWEGGLGRARVLVFVVSRSFLLSSPLSSLLLSPLLSSLFSLL